MTSPNNITIDLAMWRCSDVAIDQGQAIRLKSPNHQIARSRNRLVAFTIVELLITIAVVTLLVGLLVPAISKLSSGSRSLKCQANLKQMAIAAQNYAAMYQWFPPAIRYESRGGVMHRVAWDWVTTSANQLISPGPLWSFTDNPDEVQQCPDFNGSSNYSGDPHTGYNYNTTYIGGEGFITSPGWSNFRKGIAPHACARSSQCAMFGDGGKAGGANKFMRAPMRSEGLWLSLESLFHGGQAFRHGNTTNIAFVDGHIGSANTPNPGALATPYYLSQAMDFPNNGFLSNDDRAYDPK